jgi:hypothetical protein
VRPGGQVIADTTDAVRVLETSHPPVYYLPWTHFPADVLVPVEGTSFCEFKGEAHYFDVVAARDYRTLSEKPAGPSPCCVSPAGSLIALPSVTHAFPHDFSPAKYNGPCRAIRSAIFRCPVSEMHSSEFRNSLAQWVQAP